MNEEKISTDNINDELDIQINDNFEDENDLGIFKEISGDLDFGENLIEDNSNFKEKKDIIYYLSLAGNILIFINVLSFLAISFLLLFLKIENDPNSLDKPYLNSFCNIILPSQDLINYTNNCSGVAALNTKIKEDNENLKNTIFDEMNKTFSNVYDINNFTNSTEVKFLLDKSSSKLDVLNILNTFDLLKNDFTGSDKGSIVCDAISIDEDSVLDITCNSYSSTWDRSIKIGNNETIQGTSVSLASAFIDYIANENNHNFTIISKPDTYKARTELNSTYVKSTSFNFKLKYNNILDGLN